MSSEKVRPTGVTILAILEIIGGIIAIVSGFIVTPLFVFDAFSVVIGPILIILGIVSFFLAWGLLKGKSWAWTLALIITIISVIFDLTSFNVIGLVIDGIILYYLFRPHVKDYFGKSEQVL